MEQVAYIYNGVYIYWSGIVTALAVLSAMLMALSLRLCQKQPFWKLCVFLPCAAAAAIALARVVHWYCHWMQYSGLRSAFSDWSIGGLSLVGAAAGVLLTALVFRLLGIDKRTGALLDCLAPAAALGMAAGKLSFLFSSGDRGKMTFADEALHGLPWSTVVTDVAGGTTWRFATFFWQSMAAAAIFVLAVLFFLLCRKIPLKDGRRADGNVFLLFVTLLGAAGIILDSTRYDSSFLRSNGFISIAQIAGAVSLVLVCVFYSARSVKVNRLKFWHFILWVLFLGAMGLTGYMEYYVQRHGDLYRFCYSLMAPALAVAALCVILMYCSTVRWRGRKRAQSGLPVGTAE